MGRQALVCEKSARDVNLELSIEVHKHRHAQRSPDADVVEAFSIGAHCLKPMFKSMCGNREPSN